VYSTESTKSQIVGFTQFPADTIDLPMRKRRRRRRRKSSRTNVVDTLQLIDAMMEVVAPVADTAMMSTMTMKNMTIQGTEAAREVQKAETETDTTDEMTTMINAHTMEEVTLR